MYITTHCHVYRYIEFSKQFSLPSITLYLNIQLYPYNYSFSRVVSLLLLQRSFLASSQALSSYLSLHQYLLQLFSFFLLFEFDFLLFYVFFFLIIFTLFWFSFIKFFFFFLISFSSNVYLGFYFVISLTCFIFIFEFYACCLSIYILSLSICYNFFCYIFLTEYIVKLL